MQTAIDFSSLQAYPSSFVDKHLQKKHTDIVYSAEFDEMLGYLSIIIEHQSTPDPLMAFRILEYVCRVMRHHLQQNPNAKTLPLVFTAVLYNGQKPYCYSNDIKDIIRAPRELVDKYCLAPFQLIDLSKIDDSELKQRQWAGVLQLLLKHNYDRNILPILKQVMADMRIIEQAGGEVYIEAMLKYVVETTRIGDSAEFVKLIQQQLPTKLGEGVMTFADELRMEGKEEGKAEGRVEKSEEIARDLLAEDIDIAIIARTTKLPFSVIQSLREAEKVN